MLGQFVGEWIEGVALKTSKGKLLSSCGTMATKEMPAQLDINSEMDMLIEGLDDYLESDIRSFVKATSKMHLFSVTFQGDANDHSGEWINDKMLELIRRYTMIKKN